MYDNDSVLLYEISTSVNDEVDLMVGGGNKGIDINHFADTDEDEVILRSVDHMIGSGLPKEEDYEHDNVE